MQANILVVEDESAIQELIAINLEQSGQRASRAGSAEQAMEMIQVELPDLILMDIQLPEVDGLTATRHLKADPATHDIPVVAVTSYAMKGDETRALEAGCSGYVTKPIDKTLFLDTVARVLAGKQSG